MRKKIGIMLCLCLLIGAVFGCGEPEKEKQVENVQASEQETTQEPSAQDNSIEGDGQEVSESKVEIEKDSYLLRYDGFDTGVEIFFKDCVCEYDKGGSRVYTYFVDDPAVEAEGYAIYVQTPDDKMDIFPVKDYRVDRNAGNLYMIWDVNTFERIQGVKFVDGMGAYKIMGSYNMEELIAEAYGLESPDDGGDFDDLQVEFTGLFDENDKTVLRGKASALYNASDKKYSIDWEIDTETLNASVKLN